MFLRCSAKVGSAGPKAATILVVGFVAAGEADAQDAGAAEHEEADDGGGTHGSEDEGDELQERQGG